MRKKTMPQVTTSLSKKHIDKIKEIAQKEDLSIAKVMKKFIENGIDLHEKPTANLASYQHEEWLVRILKIVTETYAMTFDSTKTNNEFSCADDVINLIKATTQKDINEKYSIKR